MPKGVDYTRRIIEAQNDISAGTINTNIAYDSSFTGGTIVGVNSIKLAASSSSVNNYYVDFSVTLKKTLANGNTYSQKRDIVAYDGSTKIAIIADVWDTGYEPKTGDIYSLELTYPDARVSLNTIMQLGDYLTSDRYGRNLKYDSDLLLSSFKESARKCDSRSDVVLKSTVNVVANEGTVYRLSEGAAIIWEGEVRTNYNGLYVPFTKVLGKITNKWNSWKYYEVGSIVYNKTYFYKVTAAGAKTSAPSHTSGTVNGLQYISNIVISKVGTGTGPTTISLNLGKNPVLDINDKGEEISGYSLYDSDSIDYWRRLGWDEHSQASATLYQTNFTIDTSAPMFDNINMMLEHCNGIFSYSEGKYSIGIEDIPTEVTEIGVDDIIGKISIEDSGSKSAYNSLTVSYIDPANNFEARNISLFSDTFLKQDRRVPKKGNITVVGITNYYNVRLLADSFLKRSRFNTTITLTLYPEFISLAPGDVISLTYPRYSWFGKAFRVDSLTIKTNGSIGIVAKEYDDSFYSLTNMNKILGIGQKSSITSTPTVAPTNLKATNTTNNNQISDGILLTWTNPTGLSATTAIEIYASDVADNPLIVTAILGNELTFSSAHGLSVGSKLIANTAGAGFIIDKSYYVRTVVSATKVTLSEDYGGPVLVLTNNPTTSVEMNPYSLVGSISYPTNSFLHTFPNITDSVVKYYKIRYRTER